MKREIAAGIAPLNCYLSVHIGQVYRDFAAHATRRVSIDRFAPNIFLCKWGIGYGFKPFHQID